MQECPRGRFLTQGVNDGEGVRTGVPAAGAERCDQSVRGEERRARGGAGPAPADGGHRGMARRKEGSF